MMRKDAIHLKQLKDNAMMMHKFFYAAAFARECYAIWICCVSQKVAFPLMNSGF